MIGQEQAKKIISVAVYNHYKRVVTDTMDDIEIEKSNILMLGPTDPVRHTLSRHWQGFWMYRLPSRMRLPLQRPDISVMTSKALYRSFWRQPIMM